MIILSLVFLAVVVLASLFGPLLAARRGYLNVVFAVCSAVILISVYHQLLRWDIFGLVFRSALLPVMVLTTALAIFRSARTKAHWIVQIGAASTVALAVSIVWYWTVPKYADDSVNLYAEISWPLEKGHYAVIHGGARLFNHHAGVPAQQYGLDITEVNGLFRNRARGLLPANATDYRIFGRAVVAPCDGKVIFADDGHPQTPIGGGVSEDVGGNQIAITCKNFTVLLAHLKSGLVVNDGQAVRVNQVLGYVGSSGNSTEPHLHIHAVTGMQTDRDCILFSCEGVPLRLKGRSLSRNDMFSVPDE